MFGQNFLEFNSHTYPYMLLNLQQFTVNKIKYEINKMN